MVKETSTLEQRKKRVLSLLKPHKSFLVYFVLAVILWVGFFVRTRGINNLKDVTTGLHVPLALDPFVFLRYARYILEHGSIMTHDAMRYFPHGYNPASEFSLLSHFIVYLYKFLHLFNADITLEYVHILYPPIAFVAGLFFFFLLLRRLLDYRVALLATAFLSVIQPYIFRTTAGFSDKESLGMLFFFVVLYLFVVSFQTTSFKTSLFISILAGFITGLMALTWGGVQFLFLIIGIFSLYHMIFIEFDKHHFFSYAAWFLTTVISVSFIFTTRYTFSSIIFAETSSAMVLAFILGFVNLLLLRYDFLHLKKRLHNKFPFGIFILFLSVVLSSFLYILGIGWSGFVSKYKDLILSLLTPFSTTRWGRTVAESHQPYVRDWFLQFGNFYFWLFIIGAIIFVYCTFTIMKKYRYAVTGSFVFFLAAFLQSRYSATPPFDGVSLVAKLLYFGSMIFVVCLLFFLYFYTYKKNPEVYAQLHNLKKEFLFVLIWFFVMLITARIAIRILLVFAPITAVLVSFLFVKAYDLSSLILHKALKILALVLIAYFLISPTSSVSLPSYYEKAVQTTSHTGPSYNQQWQVAMDWVKKNTPQDSVFAHWWDYGYWVQTGGERATLSDGGNSGGASLNYYTGRNVLTGRTNIEALEFLKVKGATHLLIISDEIGKYGAFSSIGSNLTYDRFSSIPVFNLDPSQTLEQRDETHILFRGGAVLEEDFTFEGQLFPKGSAGIGGIIVSYKTSENTSSLLQPRAVVVYKDAQVSVPLSCLFINGQEVIFPGEGLEACFQIIPSINDGEGNNLGAGLFLSRTVWDTLFAHMYLFNQEWEGFTLAYSDDSSIPLAQYNGRLAGPLKIWEISYPDYVMYKEVYESLSLPDPKLHYV